MQQVQQHYFSAAAPTALAFGAMVQEVQNAIAAPLHLIYRV